MPPRVKKYDVTFFFPHLRCSVDIVSSNMQRIFGNNNIEYNNKIDKLLGRQIKIKNDKKTISEITHAIILKIIKYYKSFYANKFKIFNRISNFQEKNYQIILQRYQKCSCIQIVQLLLPLLGTVFTQLAA